MRVKSAACRIKAAGEGDGLKTGEFEAIVSVFGNRDAYGDVMLPGSFSKTLATWAAAGDPIPVIWSHDWSDPESHIGVVSEAREVAAGEMGANTPPGLFVRAQLDTEPGTRAARVSKLLVARRVTQFSFAYEEIKGGPITLNSERAWGVEEVDLFEVGPTLIGANQSTDLIGAKAFLTEMAARTSERVKAGSRHSAADLAHLRSMHDALTALGVPCEADTTDGKSRPGAGGDGGADGGNADGADRTPAAPAKSHAGLSPASIKLRMQLAALDIQ